MARTSNETIPRQFRLSQDTLDEIDRLAAHMLQATGIEHSRTDVIRYAVRRTTMAELPAPQALLIAGKKNKKNSKKDLTT